MRTLFTTFVLVSLVLYAVKGVSVKADSKAAVAALRATALHLSNGSGFIVKGKSGRTFLVTNYHVCSDIVYKGALYGALPDGTSVKAIGIHKDPRRDLCGGVINDYVGPALIVANTSYRSEEIYTRGYPHHVLMESRGNLGAYTSWETIFGIEELGECPKEYRKVIGLNGLISGCKAKFISQETSLYARPGSSGSPVVNPAGELVGVVSSWLTDRPYDAGIVPLNQLQEFMEAM